MRAEFHGGPADGMQQDVPDGVTEIFLTDVGPAKAAPDPFEGRPLGRMTYVRTDRMGKSGAVVFRYAGSAPSSEGQQGDRGADAKDEC